MAARRGTRAATPAPVVVEDDEVEELEELDDATDDEGIEELEDDADADTDEDVEELVDDEDVEELEEEPVVEPPAPKKRAAKPAAAKAAPVKKAVEAPEFDSNWLAEHVNKVTGAEYDARSIRMLLRKLAKDGKLQREVGVDRGRYSFSGPNDPIAKAVVTMVKSGEAAEMKKAAIDEMKAKVNKNVPEAPAKAAPAKATKAAPAKAVATKAAPAKATTTATKRTRPAAAK